MEHGTLVEMQRDTSRELINAVDGQIEIAAARLLADGVAVARLMLWVDRDSTNRGMLVDGAKVFTVSTTFAGTTFTVAGVWDKPFTHLADCDRADDYAKVAAMRCIAVSPFIGL